ncbi:hypothetical protein [Yinghuangia seranimata]|uniref:hypothetical protein n=1 Tax=Yinghuangia seranimata TaxID=408067 RepID=UPI00248C68DA|nr:hypothetical protein [Yinghuangia seranimata]MDI2126059.1 hypothetical protein [Yinghuangia seranimata]
MALTSRLPPLPTARPARGPAARWVSDPVVVPGGDGHDGYDLRDFFLDIRLAANGSFRGVHTAYLIDAKPADDPGDAARFRYRRSHVLLGYAYGRLDLPHGTGSITIEGYGSSPVTVALDRLGRGMTLRLSRSVITYRPVLYSRAVLTRAP